MTTKPDKLYRVFNGKLETATFVKEQINEGATLPAWVVRYGPNYGRKAQTAPDYWELTELAAWEKYYTELSGYGPALVGAAKDAQQKVDDCINQLNVAALKIAQLST